MAGPSRIEVELQDELAQYVRSRVGVDDLSTDGEVVRDLVRRAFEADAHQDEMRRAIAAGAASLRAGQGVDGDEFMASLDAELAELERQGR